MIKKIPEQHGEVSFAVDQYLFLEQNGNFTLADNKKKVLPNNSSH